MKKKIIIGCIVLVLLVCGAICVYYNNIYSPAEEFIDEVYNEENFEEEKVVWSEISNKTGKEIVAYEFTDSIGMYYGDFVEEVNLDLSNIVYKFNCESDTCTILNSSSLNSHYLVVLDNEKYYVYDLQNQLETIVDIPNETNFARVLYDENYSALGIILNTSPYAFENASYYSFLTNEIVVEYGLYTNITIDTDLLENLNYIQAICQDDNQYDYVDIYLLDATSGDVLLMETSVDIMYSYSYYYLYNDNGGYLYTGYSNSSEMDYLTIYNKNLEVLIEYDTYIDSRYIKSLVIKQNGDLLIRANNQLYIYNESGYISETNVYDEIRYISDNEYLVVDNNNLNIIDESEEILYEIAILSDNEKMLFVQDISSMYDMGMFYGQNGALIVLEGDYEGYHCYFYDTDLKTIEYVEYDSLEF